MLYIGTLSPRGLSSKHTLSDSIRFATSSERLDSEPRRAQEEVFEAIKPGFRAFANSPQAAADSLDPLLQVVLSHVPEAVRATTPMTLRATAGIRLLPEGPQAATAIMQAVTAKLKGAGLYVHDDYVSVLSGAITVPSRSGWTLTPATLSVVPPPPLRARSP